MSEVPIFYTGDGESHFRIETDGRIRLVLRPEERVILTGHWNKEHGVMILFKGRTKFEKASYSFAVPKEIWEPLKSSVRTLAVQLRDTNRVFCATASQLKLFGFERKDENSTHGQEYVFMDYDYWTEVDSLDAVFDFEVEKRALERANQGQMKGVMP